MRTTVTLDDDVANTVKEEMKQGDGKTFKEAVNHLIRLGRYHKVEVGKLPRKPFKVRAKNLGAYPHLNYDDIGTLLEEIEGPFHK